MTKDEALKLAFEAMLNFPDDISDEMFEAITAIKEALANVATNDTPKERVDEIQKQRHEENVQKFLGAPQPEQERPAPCAKHCEATAFQITIKNLKAQVAQPEHKCNSHPKAPHGFNRNASHANDRYTCECESWDAYEAGYQAGVTAGIEMSTETEQKPVAWLGFNERGECREVFTPKMKETFPNYPTADMIPLYTTPPQRTWERPWVSLTDEDWDEIFSNALTIGEAIKATETKLKEKNN